MAKIRVFVFLSTLLIVGLVGVYVSYYARGYRLNFQALTRGKIRFEPNGILSIKSEPDGASVFINGEFKTATPASIPLSPGTYDVEVKRNGFFSWYKRLTIEKEIVTSASVSLFKNAPSLSPITFSGAQNPVISDAGTKIGYSDSTGLWVMDTFSLPLGFTNQPKKITDGDVTLGSFIFSPDERQILLTISDGIFLLDTGSFTPQSQRVNVASKKDSILKDWQKEKSAKDQSLVKTVPADLADILERKTSSFVFSPDDSMVLYTASSSGTLPENLIASLPGASTQKQEREIKTGQTYIYDIKEDRNFLITDQKLTNLLALRWMPDSRHLLLASSSQIVIMDYDGTNRQIVYSGSYSAPFAFPYINATKLLILTNLGAANAPANLYALTIK